MVGGKQQQIDGGWLAVPSLLTLQVHQTLPINDPQPPCAHWRRVIGRLFILSLCSGQRDEVDEKN
jgi:hypothetical protein